MTPNQTLPDHAPRDTLSSHVGSTSDVHCLVATQCDIAPISSGDHGLLDTQTDYVSAPFLDDDHTAYDAHSTPVVVPLNGKNLDCNDIQQEGVLSGGDQLADDTRSGSVSPTLISEIREQWRRRQAWHRAEKSLTLQAKSMCRRLCGGDKKEAEVLFKQATSQLPNDTQIALAQVALLAMLPLLQARDQIEPQRLAVEKQLAKLAKQLPVASWIDGVRGVGIMSLAAIVGEAGDLSKYDRPAKLWKRMGLAVMPDGRQRKMTGVAGIEHGYSPGRRSVMWNIGSCIIKAGGPLKDVYDVRKAYELTRVETKGHAHNRAQRYIEKRLLRDLWKVWNKK